jgi:hypothetical protein
MAIDIKKASVRAIRCSKGNVLEAARHGRKE